MVSFITLLCWVKTMQWWMFVFPCHKHCFSLPQTISVVRDLVRAMHQLMFCQSMFMDRFSFLRFLVVVVLWSTFTLCWICWILYCHELHRLTGHKTPSYLLTPCCWCQRKHCWVMLWFYNNVVYLLHICLPKYWVEKQSPLPALSSSTFVYDWPFLITCVLADCVSPSLTQIFHVLAFFQFFSI